jgi:putative endonuclease
MRTAEYGQCRYWSLRGAKRRGNLPAMERTYCVYILTNQHHTVLYTGVTNDIVRRIFEHRAKLTASFTSRYNVDKLVFFEEFADPGTAIAREKQIKSGSRAKKVALIATINPEWRDLYEGMSL